MSSKDISQTLREFSQTPIPPPPVALERGVWAEIEKRRSLSFWRRLLPLLGWDEVVFQPRVVVAAALLAVIIAILPAVIGYHGPERGEYAVESLGLDSFAPQSSGLASYAASQPGTLEAGY